MRAIRAQNWRSPLRQSLRRLSLAGRGESRHGLRGTESLATEAQRHGENQEFSVSPCLGGAFSVSRSPWDDFCHWLLALGVLMVSAASALGQGFSTSITAPYRVTPNITYLTANNFEAKLDVYSRSDSTTPQPTLIWIHGGGWTGGTKDSATFSLLPYMEMGWNVVNVEYRLGKIL